MPSKREGICDRCGGDLYQRPDDQVETIKHRLKVYQEETAGLKDFYEERNILVTIKAEGEVEETFTKIKKSLLSKRCDCSSL
jgi:adenylate kinase